MLVNHEFSDETANVLESHWGDDCLVSFYRCCDTPPLIPDSSADVTSFAVVEEGVEDETFINAHFSSFIEAKAYYDFLCSKHEKTESVSENAKKKSIDDLSIEGMELTVQVFNILKHGCGINTIGELRSASLLEISAYPGMGKKRLKELSDAALKYGIVI